MVRNASSHAGPRVRLYFANGLKSKSCLRSQNTHFSSMWLNKPLTFYLFLSTCCGPWCLSRRSGVRLSFGSHFFIISPDTVLLSCSQSWRSLPGLWSKLQPVVTSSASLFWSVRPCACVITVQVWPHLNQDLSRGGGDCGSGLPFSLVISPAGGGGSGSSNRLTVALVRCFRYNFEESLKWTQFCI